MKIQESGEMYLETILILSQKSPYVIDPEVTDIIAGVRQGQISAFRVRERGTVEV